MAKLNNKSGKHNNNMPEYEFVDQPLHKVYNNPVDLYLPDGKANQFAKDFSKIKSHQMRKILDEVKRAVLVCDTKIEDAKKYLFVLVAMCAYNAGRFKNVKPLYKFIYAHINEKSIVDAQDIKTFDTLFTSIVAYHKEISSRKEN